MMKFSTRVSARAGFLLFAFGATAASAQSLAAAAQLTHNQVNSTEDAFSQAKVPINVPAGEVLRQTPAPLAGPSLSGSLPAAPLLPPSPAPYRPDSVLPERLIEPLTVTRFTPELAGRVPLPGYGGSELGRFDLDAPSSPLRTAGPAFGLGDPLKFHPRGLSDRRLGWLEAGEPDPRLVTAPVSTGPCASARLSQDDHPVALPRALSNGFDTTKAMATDLPGVL